MTCYKYQDGIHTPIPEDVARLMVKLGQAYVWTNLPGLFVIRYKRGATLPSVFREKA